MSTLIKHLVLVALVLLPTLAFATTDERLPGNHESWLALCFVAGSIICAWALNHALSRVRAMGTLMAALTCFGVVIWFFVYVYGSGILESPKPFDSRLDGAKPTLLWAIVTLCFIGGVLLLRVSLSQYRNSTKLTLTAVNQPDRYGSVSRMLHWTTAILFLLMIPMGIFATMIPEGTAYRLEYYVVHKTIGVLIFILVISRVLWNLYSKRPTLDQHMKPSEKKLAHLAHITLYGLLFLLPITGFIMTSFFGAPTYLFAWELAPLWEPNEKAVLLWGLLHKYLLPYIVYLVLGAHIFGVLKHQFYDKHRHILKRMVS
ncbi:cytochrome b [Alteromonas sp. KUL49]|uniref:cytochrome b n=1 Tax=Alteromonas sp. KUL49 TaxID=2480798 RepID=UPI00102EE21E|nr:cytochrome b [Alteromonas sp. KUL49]TAP38011.1 cytochrome b [Alteromonas sp. KUL49]GEA12884.1 hypothetical protein KUL49_32590 [Alteromonas sp. KUL49]